MTTFKLIDQRLGKTYFASDFHLGINGRLSSAERERQLVRWLDAIAPDAEAIYLVGDLFDFWFEYQTVVPRGFIRLLGKLAALRDASIPIYLFTGNHDMWMFDYLAQELDVPIYREPIVREINGKTFFIGHGDGLGPGDHGYKFLKKVFANRVCQWLFARLHPNLGIGLAQWLSGTSRAANHDEDRFLGAAKEWLVQYSIRKSAAQPEIDYFVFGHRHLPIDYLLPNGRSRYLNLGEWVYYNSYAVFDGTDLQLAFFENPAGKVEGEG
ncbi:MAG: UDP-2,3-diacylglucosamine hydrolase [Bacteroidetes bacterium]|nr:MAG: UDP-2,3-diacylglucosamine hydrolase [Bacteroidota bacterium]PTM13998.1 MAG: UDP-2,3-diacylglucosamine hydrolase [Bacteroidota bacterium]